MTLSSSGVIRTLSTWSLTEASGILRTKPRPVEKRQPDYDEKFDSTTIFYDAFYSVCGESIIASGPSFLNLQKLLAESQFSQNGKTQCCNISTLDRHGRILIAPAEASASLKIKGPLGNVELPVGQNGSKLFAGKRVLMTASKDNDLRWIVDWAKFNASVHGANAVLFYDNDSKKYSPDDLQSALNSVPGIDVALVVHWPFKWGPGSTSNQHWDSNFAQLGAWEHARWKFLQLARSVLNSDIDEFVLTNQGESIFDLVERSETGYISFPGYWIENIMDDRNRWSSRRHSDFAVQIKPGIADCQTKWAVVPYRSPFGAQWAAHAVDNHPHSSKAGSLASYRHFKAISHSWKYDRDSPTKFSSEKHGLDQDLIVAMAKVFAT